MYYQHAYFYCFFGLHLIYNHFFLFFLRFYAKFTRTTSKVLIKLSNENRPVCIVLNNADKFFYSICTNFCTFVLFELVTYKNFMKFFFPCCQIYLIMVIKSFLFSCSTAVRCIEWRQTNSRQRICTLLLVVSSLML